MSVCSWRVTREHLGSMLWFSPSWIDQILNLPTTALPLQHRSDHPILTTGAALTRRAASKTTGRSEQDRVTSPLQSPYPQSSFFHR